MSWQGKDSINQKTIMNHMNKNLLKISCIAMVMVAFITSCKKVERNENSETVNAELKVSTEYEEKPEVIATSVEIANEYDRDAVQADLKYKFKKVEITGEVISIDRYSKKNPYIVLRGSKEYNGPECEFEGYQSEEISNIKQGEKVTVLCEGRGNFIKIAKFGQCGLIKNLETSEIDSKDNQLVLTDSVAMAFAHKVMSDFYKRYDIKRDVWRAVKDKRIREMRIKSVDIIQSNNKDTLHILATGDIPNNDGAHVESGFVSAFIIEPKQDGTYNLIAKGLNIKMGGFGHAPEKATRITVGDGVEGWVIEDEDVNWGIPFKSHYILVPFNGKIISSQISISTSNEGSIMAGSGLKLNKFIGSYTFDKKSRGPIYNIIYTSKSIVDGKRMPLETEYIRFNKRTGRYVGKYVLPDY